MLPNQHVDITNILLEGDRFNKDISLTIQMQWNFRLVGISFPFDFVKSKL